MRYLRGDMLHARLLTSVQVLLQMYAIESFGTLETHATGESLRQLPAFYGTLRFINLFTRAHNLTLL
jgi:hypothetical protein